MPITPVKRGRGRPSKAAKRAANIAAGGTGRGRGRPPKTVVPVVSSDEDLHLLAEEDSESD